MTGASSGSFLGGRNPFEFNMDNPLSLFLVQLVLIIIFCRVLKFVLSPFKQPSVIAEIITGIILGPSVLGRIPGYSTIIFPKASIPFLNLISNIGLILFLFLVGLELDPKMLRNGAKRALFISIAGMAVPFGVGAAVSFGLYKLIETDHTVAFSTYLVFIGVAMSITAFPVLARILTELKLLKTFVGSTVICAAAVDDCTSWCLLALTVSLINSTGGIQALYVFLMGLGYAGFLVFGFRPLLRLLLKRTNSFNNGPSTFIICIIFMIIFISAFVTDAIGIDGIFGGFLAGVIIPHDNGFATKITEKIEDIVTILFLPIYFTISGLKTQIGSLNDGTSWGMTILVIFVACIGKITGCTIAAKLGNLKWRESFAIGVLMNCKGLVELIVLNIGHDAKVISDKTFAMMVIMALVTTFITTPLTSWIYPKYYYLKDINRASKKSSSSSKDLEISVCINKIEHIPSIMKIIDLFNAPLAATKDISPNKNECAFENLKVYAIRLIEITERYSSLLIHSDINTSSVMDPVASVFKTFTRITNISSEIFVRSCCLSEYSENITHIVNEVSPHFLIIPWSGGKNHNFNTNDSNVYSFSEDSCTAPKYANYIKDLYEKADVPTCVLVDRGSGNYTEESENDVFPPDNIKNIFVPFFGGSDDRTAFELSMRFSRNFNVKVSIVHYKYNSQKTACVNIFENLSLNPESKKTQEKYNIQSSDETINPTVDENRLDNSSLDDIITNSCLENKDLSNVTYSVKESDMPISMFFEDSKKLNRNTIVIVGRRKTVKINELYGESRQRIDNSRRKVLGDVAECLLLSGSKSSLLVVQGKNKCS